MSWIRSESGLPRHPKTLLLKKLLGVELDVVIGRIHLLWWWCLEYAIDGDLSKKEPKVIQESCQIPLKFLIKSGFVDSRPYRRIHDWWENQGSYLQSRFNKTPDKWQRIKYLYERQEDGSQDRSTMGPRMGVRNRTDVQTYGRTDKQDVRTDVDLKKKEASRPAPGGASAPLGLTKVEADDMPEFDHEDFKKAGWISSERPGDDNQFAWAHFDRAMTNEERVQSKMREKFVSQKKHWN